MIKLEIIQRDIEALAPDELARFRRWFAEYDAANWDAQIDADSLSGRLDALAEQALADHRTGRTKPL